MDNNQKLPTVDNYEIIKRAKDVVVTYSLSDCNSLTNLDEASITAQERDDNTYDLFIKNDKGLDLVSFKSLDAETLEDLKGKKIILAGISEKTNDIEEAILIASFNIDYKSKLKVGR